jgi:hypothetical protein
MNNMKPTPKTNSELIRELERLGKGGEPKFLNYGICNNVEIKTGVCIDYLPQWKTIVSKWKYFSGYTMFPITLGAKDQAECCFHVTPKWTGKYGKRRREFARYLAREFQKAGY